MLPRRCSCGREEWFQTPHGHSGSGGSSLSPRLPTPACPLLRIPRTYGHIWGGEGGSSATDNLQLPYGLRLFLSYLCPNLPRQRNSAVSLERRAYCFRKMALMLPSTALSSGSASLHWRENPFLKEIFKSSSLLRAMTVRFDLAPSCRIGTYFIFNGRSEGSWCIIINKSALSRALRMAVKHLTCRAHWSELKNTSCYL